MKWVDTIVSNLRPGFGGIPTFVEDPDHLLDMAEVREACRACGMTLSDWDGMPATLLSLKCLEDTEMPLLMVGSNGHRHLVESCLQDFRWEIISIGALLPKFAPEVVKAIPIAFWDSLLTLHEAARKPHAPVETALLFGRALYGVDLEFLRYGDGWMRLLTHLAISEESLPLPIARAIVETAPSPWLETAQPETLSDPANARTALRAILHAKPGLYEDASRAEQLLLAELRPSYTIAIPPVDLPDLCVHWEQSSQRPQDVLTFGLTYAQAQNAQSVPEKLRLEINRRFVLWLKQNYSVILSTQNPTVLRLPTLLDTLDAEFADARFVLFVVDSLSLAAWERVQHRWLADGIIGGAKTRAAFAVLPTIMSLSRRALFEGKLPSQFSPEPHSQALERKRWTQRYDNGAYFSVGESTGFSDGLARGIPRLCVVDVSWDKRGHSIDPRTDSIVDAANIWAGRTPLREMVKSALSAGYRVLLTADHGQVECTGKGRLNLGTLPEERSKRVVIFGDATVCKSAMNDWTDNFRPMGLPQGIFPLFAAEFHSFDLTDAATVSHGGLSLDEALVPVVEVRA